MVLQSIWADASDTKGVADPSIKVIHKKAAATKSKKKTIKDKAASNGNRNPTEIKKEEVEKPKNRLVFSVKDVEIKGDQKGKATGNKSLKKTKANDEKLEVLKKRIEEQKRLLEKNQHEKQQKALLEEFLSGDAKFDWGDEDEENEIIEKLNNSLKV